MTIGKKLYFGFGAVLVILVALFLVNIFAGWKEHRLWVLGLHNSTMGYQDRADCRGPT